LLSLVRDLAKKVSRIESQLPALTGAAPESKGMRTRTPGACTGCDQPGATCEQCHTAFCRSCRDKAVHACAQSA
jgi:hypothetical protein